MIINQTFFENKQSLQLNFNFMNTLGSIETYQDKVEHVSELDMLTADQYLSSCNTHLVTAQPVMDDFTELGVTHSASIAHHFSVGFADRNRASSLQALGRQDKNALIGSYQRTGLYKANGRSRLWGQFTFPLQDLDGALVGVYGFYRSPYLDHSRENIVLFPGVDVGVFNADCLKQESEVTLTNCAMTACRLWSPENLSVAAIVSHHMTVTAFINLLKGLNLKKVIICAGVGCFNQHWKSELIKALDFLKIDYVDGA